MPCLHESVHCLNHYELIRKYHCDTCDGVMMCRCDEDIATRFLPHQLSEGTELDTRVRIAVTHGFQDGICQECRGLSPEAHPKAPIHGNTSKIRRYYWREIMFETYRRFADRAAKAGLDPTALYSDKAKTIRKEIERDVLHDIKALHEANPKYQYHEESQAEIIHKYGVEVVHIDATFAPKTKGKRSSIVDGNETVEPEEFVARHYERQGWQVLFVESVPIHVLFGIYMWLLIQDAADPMNRLVMFGSRSDYEGARKGVEIRTLLPEDFGTTGYARRRRAAIDEYFNSGMLDDLEWLFDYWLGHSVNFREYLWAHRDADVERAKELILILPPEVIIRILRYLVGGYWQRYLGWPDLLVHRGEDYYWAEVKASRDKLSEDQKRWIRDNATELRLPFKLVKIHRRETAEP